MKDKRITTSIPDYLQSTYFWYTREAAPPPPVQPLQELSKYTPWKLVIPAPYTFTPNALDTMRTIKEMVDAI